MVPGCEQCKEHLLNSYTLYLIGEYTTMDDWGDKTLNWLMEGPDAGDNRGANPRAPWGWMEPYREQILAQSWMCKTITQLDRVHTTDPEALLTYLAEVGALTEEGRELFMAKRTLWLMEAVE